MQLLLIFRNNCKNSKQVLDILSLSNDNGGVKMLCLNEIPDKKQSLVLKKYKIREVPCLVTETEIVYSSEMFSFIKKISSGKKDGDSFFQGRDNNGFSQSFASFTGDDIGVQDNFHRVEGISSPSTDNFEDNSKQKTKSKSKNKSSSEVDKRYEQMMASRDNDFKDVKKKLHNDRLDFTKPIYKI